jgi:hypothetical protein
MKDIVSEWLRREIRNLLGSPAQVRILSMSLFFFFPCRRSMYTRLPCRPCAFQRFGHWIRMMRITMPSDSDDELTRSLASTLCSAPPRHRISFTAPSHATSFPAVALHLPPPRYVPNPLRWLVDMHKLHPEKPATSEKVKHPA